MESCRNSIQNYTTHSVEGSEGNHNHIRSANSCAGSTKSAFSRVTSTRNLNESFLPSFLRIDIRDPLKYLRSGETEEQTNQKKSHERLDDILLIVRNRNLSRRDLKGLKSKQMVSSNIINSVLSLFKQMNSEMQKIYPNFVRVLIANTEFAEWVFSEEKRPVHSRVNVLKYEEALFSFLLLPIYTGYWSLVSINLKEKKVNYFNPLKEKKFIDEILVAVFRFVEEEVKFYENIDIADSSFADIVYEEVEEKEVVDESDSGVYVLEHAENISLNREDVVSGLDRYRKLLLKLLFVNGEKTELANEVKIDMKF